MICKIHITKINYINRKKKESNLVLYFYNMSYLSFTNHSLENPIKKTKTAWPTQSCENTLVSLSRQSQPPFSLSCKLTNVKHVEGMTTHMMSGSKRVLYGSTDEVYNRKSFSLAFPGSTIHLKSNLFKYCLKHLCQVLKNILFVFMLVYDVFKQGLYLYYVMWCNH